VGDYLSLIWLAATSLCSDLVSPAAFPAGRHSVPPGPNPMCPPLAQVVKCGRTSWPVSRILCTGRLAASGRRSSISACRCRQALAAYPQASGGPPSIACAARRIRRTFWPCSGWGLPSRPGHPGRWWSLTPPFHPYPGPVDLMGRGGLFSVALSRGSPRVAVSNHPALRSPDFPRRARCRARRDRPASSSAPSA